MGISSKVIPQRFIMRCDLHFLGMMAVLLNLCEGEAQFGFGGGAALQNCVGSNCNQNNAFGGRTFGSTPGFGSQGGVAVQNCVGSNCNSNNNFGRKRREVLEEVIARVEEEPNTERRRLLEEILTEVEEFELSGERRHLISFNKLLKRWTSFLSLALHRDQLFPYSLLERSFTPVTAVVDFRRLKLQLLVFL